VKQTYIQKFFLKQSGTPSLLTTRDMNALPPPVEKIIAWVFLYIVLLSIIAVIIGLRMTPAQRLIPFHSLMPNPVAGEQD
jgi:hypothetical protein